MFTITCGEGGWCGVRVPGGDSGFSCHYYSAPLVTMPLPPFPKQSGVIMCQVHPLQSRDRLLPFPGMASPASLGIIIQEDATHSPCPSPQLWIMCTHSTQAAFSFTAW